MTATNIPLPQASEIEEVPHDGDAAAREHFIPLRKSDLRSLLADQPDVSPAERAQFLELATLLEATFHYEYHARLEELKDAYAPFDPDADTRPYQPLTAAERDDRAAALFERFVELLQRCNFQRLSRADIEASMQTVSDWGVNLDVNFDVFDRLEVFARGDAVGRRSRRRWRNYYRREEVEIAIYRRLVLIFRLTDHEVMENGVPDTVYVKLFKNIHKQDLEMLLPGTTVKMSLVDRTKIAFPTVSGLGVSAYKATQIGLFGKLLKGGIMAALAGGLWAIFGAVVVLSTLIGYAVKSFLSYVTTKNKYQLNLTRSLYFQNLDNNAGALARLTDEAEDQECCEALLGWFLLWRHAGKTGLTDRELDRRAEKFLREHAGLEVDFQHDDALHTLRRLRLVETTTDGKLVPPSIAECLHRLDHAWDHYFHHPPVLPNSEPPDATCVGPRERELATEETRMKHGSEKG